MMAHPPLYNMAQAQQLAARPESWEGGHTGSVTNCEGALGRLVSGSDRMGCGWGLYKDALNDVSLKNIHTLQSDCTIFIKFHKNYIILSILLSPIMQAFTMTQTDCVCVATFSSYWVARWLYGYQCPCSFGLLVLASVGVLSLQSQFSAICVDFICAIFSPHNPKCVDWLIGFYPDWLYSDLVIW